MSAVEAEARVTVPREVVVRRVRRKTAVGWVGEGRPKAEGRSSREG